MPTLFVFPLFDSAALDTPKKSHPAPHALRKLAHWPADWDSWHPRAESTRLEGCPGLATAETKGPLNRIEKAAKLKTHSADSSLNRFQLFQFSFICLCCCFYFFILFIFIFSFFFYYFHCCCRIFRWVCKTFQSTTRTTGNHLTVVATFIHFVAVSWSCPGVRFFYTHTHTHTHTHSHMHWKQIYILLFR